MEKIDTIEHHLAALMEHFDVVQVLACSHDGSANRTTSYWSGRGNMYARQGLAVDWLDRLEDSKEEGRENV